VIKKNQDAKAARIKTDAEGLKARIEGLTYEEKRQAGEEGKLFGSVTSQDIAAFLDQHKLGIERRRISLDEPIKTLGEHTVAIRLHADVAAQLRVNVVRSE